MSEYTHRMTLAVPASLMIHANQLALIAGESLDDVNTFIQTNWRDSDNNHYSVCSTVIKPIVLGLLNAPLSSAVLKSDIVDMALAQHAMDNLVVYEEGVVVSPDKIVVGIDIDPITLFGEIGLSLIL